MSESLLSLTPGFSTKQQGISDSRACKLFKYLWNKMYPGYPVRIKWNNHDFGTYPDIVISDDLFSQSFDDEKTFHRSKNDGIESESGFLCDWWNKKVENKQINHRAWAIICAKTGLNDSKPFSMEY